MLLYVLHSTRQLSSLGILLTFDFVFLRFTHVIRVSRTLAILSIIGNIQCQVDNNRAVFRGIGYRWRRMCFGELGYICSSTALIDHAAPNHILRSEFHMKVQLLCLHEDATNIYSCTRCGAFRFHPRRPTGPPNGYRYALSPCPSSTIGP